MTTADIDAAISLSTLAGWNQTKADWHRLLSLEPHGCFVACIGDRVQGTVTTTSYQQRFGWIGMVLVHPDVRRCGMGSALLRRGVEYLQAIGVETIKLDATPLGQPVYEKAGFVVEYELERWEGIAAQTDWSTPGADSTPGAVSTPGAIVPADFARVVEFDKAVFGADRSTLLQEIYESAPEYSSVCFRDEKVVGYALGRFGTRANYLGPWVADDAETARTLIRNILCRWAGEMVYVDINLSNAHAVEVARDLGLHPQRKLIRMYLGPNNFPGQPEWICGIAGPEVG